MILVLRGLGLGDFLTALPALRALADAFPSEQRLLAAPTALAPLARLSGSVDDVMAVGPLEAIAGLVTSPQVAVNLHGRGPQSHRVLLAVRPQRLIAFAHPEVPESASGPVWRADEHEVRRWCRLLEESGIPADPGRLDLVPPGFAPPTAPPAETWGATLVHPGAASAARRWPVERWIAVAKAERRRGRHVLVTGSADEVSLARAIAAGAGLGSGAVTAGETSLMELTSLIAAAGRVVCGDTGVAHLATALRTPSVVLFGPTSPKHWGPPEDRPWHRVLWDGQTGDPHADVPDRGLLAITVLQVLAALEELDGIAGRAARRPAARRRRVAPGGRRQERAA